jgi:hypothetical protein
VSVISSITTDASEFHILAQAADAQNEQTVVEMSLHPLARSLQQMVENILKELCSLSGVRDV